MTLFPTMIEAVTRESIIGRAIKKGLIDIRAINIRDFAQDKHCKADDAPYGGGKGLVMLPEPLYLCHEQLQKGEHVHTVMMSAQGKPFCQQKARELLKHGHIILVCGHYEGIDQRFIDTCVDEEISMGDFVLTGGEIPALAVADACCRMVPGVLSEDICFQEESHWNGLLEYPQYTRPEVWRGKAVPEILLSGHHAKISRWRRKMSLLRTKTDRPDLFKNFVPEDKQDKKILEELADNPACFADTGPIPKKERGGEKVDKLTGFEPRNLIENFKRLSAIPRSSKNEKAASDFIVSFAKEHGLCYYQDGLWNVIVKKPGTKGCEQLPPVMLQGHLDMVCEKTAESTHDFEHDGLELYEENGYLRAKGTTLGADNGAAVALMLTVLEDETLQHPPLECVFTTQEEIGLNGAAALDPAQMSARTMINLDSEDEGIATVSCAGGVQAVVSLSAEQEKPVSPCKAVKVRIGGLRGGHSGIDIAKERGNAVLLMGRVLYQALNGREGSLVSLYGGNKDNAIPRECEAVINVKTEDLDEIMRLAEAEANCICDELHPTEPDAFVKVEPDNTLFAGFSSEQTKNILAFLQLTPNGVLNKNVKAGDFVVCSSNLGIARAGDGKAAFTFMVRSSVESLKQQMMRRLACLKEATGFTKIEFDAGYPGWAYAENSKIRDIVKECYKEQYGKDLVCEAIHAGLECGLFSGKLPGLDAIAIGPQIDNCHTPDERLDLGSFRRTYQLVCAILNRLTKQSA